MRIGSEVCVILYQRLYNGIRFAMGIVLAWSDHCLLKSGEKDKTTEVTL